MTVLCMSRAEKSKYPAKKLPKGWTIMHCERCGNECVAPSFYKLCLQNDPKSKALCTECCAQVKEEDEHNKQDRVFIATIIAIVVITLAALATIWLVFR